MDPKVALAVAIIAAAASIAGAAGAWTSARAARLSADGIDRRRHMIESLDAETESFRESVTAVYQTIYETKPDDERAFEIKVAIRAQILKMHPLATPELSDGVNKGVQVARTIGRSARTGEPAQLAEGANWSDFHKEASRIFKVQSEKRRQLLEDVQKARRLEVSMFFPLLLPFGNALRVPNPFRKRKNTQSVDD